MSTFLNVLVIRKVLALKLRFTENLPILATTLTMNSIIQESLLF
jgi:hypothetical protein